jgi:hypothetical protein
MKDLHPQVRRLILVLAIFSSAVHAESFAQMKVGMLISAEQNLEVKIKSGEKTEICVALYRVGAVYRYFRKDQFVEEVQKDLTRYGCR